MKIIKKWWRLVCYLLAGVFCALGCLNIINSTEAMLSFCTLMIFIMIPCICDEVVKPFREDNEDD